MKLIGSWKFYRRTLMIALPIMLQNLITNFVALIDNIMVGQVGTEQMSGVAIVNQLFFVFNLTVFGVISGASIFCAQYFGKKDYEGVRTTFRFKLLSVCVVLFVGIGAFLLWGDGLISLYLHDGNQGINLEETFRYAKEYMGIMLIGLVPFAVEQAYSSTLREGGIATPPMVAGIIAVLTNTFLNFLLIFGMWGLPALGVKGAAIATVISRFVQAGIVIAWTHSHRKSLIFAEHLYRTMRVPFKTAKRIMVKGVLPLTANEGLWSLGMSVLVQCYSMRGINVVAALNVSNTVVNLFNVLFIAFGSGIAVVLGQMLGADELDEAKEAAPKLIFFSGAMCVGIGAVMALFSWAFPLAYNTTADVRNLATAFIIISALSMPIHGTLHATYFTLRSGGKTLTTFLFDCGFSWLIAVPLAYSLAYFTALPIIPIYFCCQMIEIIKLFIGIVLIKKEVWISNIVNA